MPQFVARLREDARQRLRDPVAWSDLIQLVKTVVAAVLAWVLATEVFGLPQAFLAPWSALLVVHATVYRTFSRGLRQVVSAVLGVLVAWLIGNSLGITPWAIGVLLLIGLLLGSIAWFKDETTTIAATGLIVLTTGFSTHDQLLISRLFDTAIGVVVGLLVNFVVWPPLRDYSAARAVGSIDDGIGALLQDIASQLVDRADEGQVDEWVHRTQELDEELDEAWALVRQARESSRLNPRRAAKGLRTGDLYEQILSDNEQAVAEIRSMARTVGHSIQSVNEWDPEFRERWLSLLREAGVAIAAPDAARVTRVRADLNDLAHELSTEDLSGRHWPEYGALILNLRNVVTSMDRVAEANPVVVPRYANRQRVLKG
jgi:uncharacterized membrane protein YgaE (UPF0421/DUF939 family)